MLSRLLARFLLRFALLQSLYQVCRITRPRPWALCETQRTTQCFPEIRYAFIEIHIPFLDSAHELLLVVNRIGRAGVRTRLATHAKIVGAEFIG